MTNMAIPYSRPDRALLTLRDEVYAAYGYTPARASEFVTGYKDPGNFTGHNADANGVVHAIDIFTDENGNLPEAAGRELAEKLRLIGKATNRFSYLIHDMCPTPGTAWPRIAGQFNGWVWQEYGGSSPHTDHVHVSMCDLYWGDPAPVPSSVYDSTASWGISSIRPAGTITPEPQEPFTMGQYEELMRQIGLAHEKENNIAAAVVSGFKAGRVYHGQTHGKINALTSIVEQLARGQGVTIDMAAVEAAAKKGAAEALAEGVDINLTVNGKDAA